MINLQPFGHRFFNHICWCFRNPPLEVGRFFIHIPGGSKGNSSDPHFPSATSQDLCDKPLGAADYLALGQAFHTIFIADIPRLTMQVPSTQIGCIQKISKWQIHTIQRLDLLKGMKLHCVCMYLSMYFCIQLYTYIQMFKKMKQSCFLSAPTMHAAFPRMCTLQYIRTSRPAMTYVSDKKSFRGPDVTFLVTGPWFIW